mmetsp:Transcript_29134/g.38316  ORF Transcript_29134/g.38316 Transcript_29134/m.38316 type:complete len:199 (-) Transcript_29134:220-816(-)
MVLMQPNSLKFIFGLLLCISYSVCCHSFSGTANVFQPCYAIRTAPSFVRIKKISNEKGMGAIAHDRISVGQIVGDYCGEIITKAQMERRYLSSQQHLMIECDKDWLSSRKERGCSITGDYLFGVSSCDLFIDAEDEDISSWARYINHSTSPNLCPKSLPSGMDGKPRVWFVATRDIFEGEELCYDYGDNYWQEGDMVV